MLRMAVIFTVSYNRTENIIHTKPFLKDIICNIFEILFISKFQYSSQK